MVCTIQANNVHGRFGSATMSQGQKIGPNCAMITDKLQIKTENEPIKIVRILNERESLIPGISVLLVYK